VFELSARVTAAQNAHRDSSASSAERMRNSARSRRRVEVSPPRAWFAWPRSAGMTKPRGWLLWSLVARSRGLLHLRCDLGARYRRLWRPGVDLVLDPSSGLFASNSAEHMPDRHVSGDAREICAAHGSRRAYLAGLRRELQKRERALGVGRCTAANLWKEKGLRNPAVGA
jgi:hypothetical protein